MVLSVNYEKGYVKVWGLRGHGLAPPPDIPLNWNTHEKGNAITLNKKGGVGWGGVAYPTLRPHPNLHPTCNRASH